MRVQLGNRLMHVSVMLANKLAHTRGIPGGLENPVFSRLWLCPPVLGPGRLLNVHDVFTDF
eukprot:9088209-Pyramimonas_sp.AAC.1